MRIARTAALRLAARGTHGLLQLHRKLLQSHPAALRPGLSLAHLLRTGDANRPTVRHPLNRPRNRGNFTPIAVLVTVEGQRWAIEDSFETAKNELGLDHNETRSWHGWHRHVSLVMLAFAMMAAIRRQAN